MSFRSEELAEAISGMLLDRAVRGNCQSKHGIDAAYDWEVLNLLNALDTWLNQQPAKGSRI